MTDAAATQTTQTMTITEADYTGSSTHVVIEFTLVTTGGGMERNAEETQTLDVLVEGDALSWTQTMTQDVTHTFGGQTSNQYDEHEGQRDAPAEMIRGEKGVRWNSNASAAFPRLRPASRWHR